MPSRPSTIACMAAGTRAPPVNRATEQVIDAGFWQYRFEGGGTCQPARHWHLAPNAKGLDIIRLGGAAGFAVPRR